MTFAADPVGGSLHVEGGQIAQWDVAGDLYLELEVVDQGHQLHESLGVAADDNDRRTHVPVGSPVAGIHAVPFTTMPPDRTSATGAVN